MQRIIVSDGFYSNPEQMKMLFSTLDYGKNENFLQGLMCPLKYANIDMLKQIEYLINVPEDSFEFIDGSGSFVNFWQARGGTSGNSPVLWATAAAGGNVNGSISSDS